MATSPTGFHAPYQRLYVNIDHVATLRQARRGTEPDPVAAARVVEDAGADGITAHLREDRRHIGDDDIRRLHATVRTALNFECAATEEMLAIAERIRPSTVTLVPERREEITTEGGLDLTRAAGTLRDAVARLKRAGTRVSLFIDPTADAVRRARDLETDAVELHTGQYAHSPGEGTIHALAESSRLAHELGLGVHAGHGLSVTNVGPIAAIPEIEELNIGHAIVGRAVFIGLAAAVRETHDAMRRARAHVRADVHVTTSE